MRLLSYNIHQGLDRLGRPRLDEMAAAIEGRAPDIVACQEVLDGDDPALASQADRLAQRLGMHAHFVANAVVRRGRLGNATLTTLPVVEVEHLDLSMPRFEARGMLRVEVRGGPSIWNVHLGLTRGQRAKQWRAVAALLDGAASRLLLCGDFNDWSGTLDRIVRRAGFANSLQGVRRARRRTFPARWPAFSLDRVYLRGLRLRNGCVLRGRPWSRLSDHLPVEVEFDRAVGDEPC